MHKRVKLEAAVGMPLAHDVTEIRPGDFKGPAFKKGHILREDDLDHLRRLGKNHLFVLDIAEDEMHEDEAVEILVEALSGENVGPRGEPAEGKIALVALCDGLLDVDVQALMDFNMLGEVMCATRHTGVVVRKGQELAASRAIPLVVKRDVVQKAAGIAEAAGGIIAVRELKNRNVGIVITGSEVYQGLIEDRFESIIRNKVKRLGSAVSEVILTPDDGEKILGALRKLLDGGAEVIVVTGGMSVDPDDVTRASISKAGASHLVYGSPVLPGAMLLVSRIGDVPVIGVPACAIYYKATVFDLVFPRLLAGQDITRKEIAALGHGGFCLGCDTCRFPDCPFGKGEIPVTA